MEDFSELINQSTASIEKEDLHVLLPEVARIEPKIILETGTWKGRSADLFQKAFHPELLITMDSSPRFEDTVDPQMLNHFLMYETDSHSEDAFNRVGGLLGGRPVDFLFIDGDHSYEGVKKDWDMYKPLVREGGIIALHDVLYHADKTEEVDVFWQEIKWNHTHKEIMVGERSTGIGVIYL